MFVGVQSPVKVFSVKFWIHGLSYVCLIPLVALVCIVVSLFHHPPIPPRVDLHWHLCAFSTTNNAISLWVSTCYELILST